MSNQEPRKFRRAKTPERKREVREMLLVAGRQFLNNAEISQLSLRRIAQSVGMTPSSVYNYFADQQEFFAEILEHELTEAMRVVGAIIRSNPDPKERLRSVFLGAVDYWLSNPMHFDVLFTRSKDTQDTPHSANAPVSMVTCSHEQYRAVVKDFFDTLDKYPVPLIEATDTLILTTHGAILFARRTQQSYWSPVQKISAHAIDALLSHWSILADSR